MRQASALHRRILGIAVVVTFYGGLVAVAGDAAFEGGGSGGNGELVAGPGASGAVSSSSGGDTTGGGSGPDAGGSGTPGTPGTPNAGPATSGGGGTGGPGGTGTASGGPPPPGSASGDPTSTGPGPATGTAPAAGGGGGNLGPIKIGVHDDDPGAAFSQFGVQGGPTGNQGEWIVKIVEWINAHGGMGGRPVELVHHVTESLNGSFDQQTQRACAVFTEDNDTVAVVSGARTPTLNLVDCLAAHDTPLVWSYQFMADDATLARYPDHLYMPAMVSADRLGVWMDALAEDGFFKGGTIGVVRYDNDIHEHVTNNVLAPRLAAHGFRIAEQVAFRGATGASSAADLSAQANNAILRFQSRGVDRVIMVPTSAVMPLLFFTAADSQQYRPKYTMTTYDVPSFQAENAGPSQLEGAKAFGWTPAGDVLWEQEPEPLQGRAATCFELTRAAEPTGNGSVRRYCDGLFFLKDVFDRGAAPTTAGIRGAVDAMSTSYESSWTFATALGPNRHDGAAVGRIVAYDTGCECFQYTGPDRPIP